MSILDEVGEHCGVVSSEAGVRVEGRFERGEGGQFMGVGGKEGVCSLRRSRR